MQAGNSTRTRRARRFAAGALIAVGGMFAPMLTQAGAAVCLLNCSTAPPPSSTTPTTTSTTTTPAPAPVPTPTGIPAPISVGVNDRTGHGTGLSRQIFQNLLADSGAQLDRWTIDWGNYEPKQGSFSQGYLDFVKKSYDGALQRGVRPVVVLFGSPRWTLDPNSRGPQGGFPCKDTTKSCQAPPNVRNATIKSAWQAWVKKVAATFPEAAAIEVWNEPNMHWAWGFKQDPTLYALMVSAAKSALTSAKVTIPVLAGGLANTKTNDDYLTSIENMLKALYANAKGSFDAISFHSYPCAPPADPRTVMQATLERVRRVKGANGDLSRPLWITEAGASTGTTSVAMCGYGFTYENQGPSMQSVIQWARDTEAQAGDLRALVVNSMANAAPRSDLSTPNSNGSDEYGSVAWTQNSDGTFSLAFKPGYQYLKCAFRQEC